MCLETCWFGSCELGFETTQLPNPGRCLTHADLGGSGQGVGDTWCPTTCSTPGAQGTRTPPRAPLAHRPAYLRVLRHPVCFGCQHCTDSPGLAVCVPCHAAAQDAEFGAAGDRRPHVTQHEDAQMHPARNASPKAFLPPCHHEELEAVKGWGQAFPCLPASHAGVAGACGLLNLLPSLGARGIIHIL